MARIDPSIPTPTASLLDRLIVERDAAPANPPSASGPYAGPASAGPTEGRRLVERAVLRDLGWLLNARAPRGDAGRGPELAATVLDFGLPDITLLDLRDGEQRARLEREIGDAIARFEPRLRGVRVEFRSDEDPRSTGATRFHVEGRLLVEPEPVEFPFDATVHWVYRRIEVERSAT